VALLEEQVDAWPMDGRWVSQRACWNAVRARLLQQDAYWSFHRYGFGHRRSNHAQQHRSEAP
jgi:hypothetical protein